MTKQPNMPLRMQIVWDVLEAAKDAGDAAVIAACRRLIVAHRLAVKNAQTAADFRLVNAFA